MCGITGFFSYKNKIVTKRYYEAHLKISHRGPDDEGFIYKNERNKIEYLKGNDTIYEYQEKEHIINKPPSSLILGHRRLSIIDLTYHGHQPYNFHNLYLVYNGEIYNYIELRNELKKKGYIFETNTDTEVFLKAFHYWGVDAFNKFNGMWAAAIYDSIKDEILLTRDRFGIKPLYYTLSNNNLIFGSEIKFVASFFETLKSDAEMVYDYIEYGYISHTNKTFFKNIMQLKAGHFAIYNRNGFKEIEYFSKKRNDKCNVTIDEIREVLIDSVKLRTRSDVLVASLLSGGMDSSSIVSIIFKENLVNNMNTFTITFEEKNLDYEAKYVDDITKMTNFKNTKVFLKPKNLTDDLVYIIESPYRSFAENARYEIFSYIKNNTHIKVLLNGEGGDEVFSGYNFHYFSYLNELILERKLLKLFKEYFLIKKHIQKTNKEIMKGMISYLFEYWSINKPMKTTFFIGDFKKKKVYFHKKPLINEVLKNRYFSALPEYLKYADKISMYFSLEVRVPFLDYKLVKKADCLKSDEMIKNGIAKYSLREAVKNIIPKSIYKRKDKKGFFIPQDLWTQNEFSNIIINEIEYIKTHGLFEYMNKNIIYNYYLKYGINDKIWRVYCLSRWKKVWNITS